MTIDTGIPANEGCAAPGLKRVFLVEDDCATLDALSRMLRHLGYAVDAFRNIDSFLAHPRDDAPAVLVTDMRIGAESGLDLQRRIADAATAMPVIFISGASSTRETVLAMKAGAHEFLAKPVASKVLVEAIESALVKHRTRLQDAERRARAAASLDMLSPREREVFWLLARGCNNSQIVEQLGISLPTAKQYKSEVMRKLEFDTLADLIDFSACLRTMSAD